MPAVQDAAAGTPAAATDIDTSSSSSSGRVAWPAPVRTAVARHHQAQAACATSTTEASTTSTPTAAAIGAGCVVRSWRGTPSPSRATSSPSTQLDTRPLHPLKFNTPPRSHMPATPASCPETPLANHTTLGLSTGTTSTDDARTPAPAGSCAPTTPSSRADPNNPHTPHQQQHPRLLALPDTLLLALWDLLDASSRASLYHSCRQLWSSPALNGTLRALSCHSQRVEQDLLTWPRHAPPPCKLRLMNGGSSAWNLVVEQLAPLPPLQAAIAAAADQALGLGEGATGEEGEDKDEEEEAWGQGRRASSFVCFLSRARRYPRAVELLSQVEELVLQGRGKDGELCKRLPSLLGALCPRLTSLQLDWCVAGGEVFAAASCWLPSLTRLSLVGLNAQDARGAWPHALTTYSDIARLNGLTKLEVVDCHLPFLELGVQDVTPLEALTRLESLRLVFSDEHEHPWPGSKPCFLLLGLSEVAQACPRLSELVLDGVHLAKCPSLPPWPALTSLALGYLSGCFPGLITNLALHDATRLKHLTLGPIRCVGGSSEAKRLNLTRLQQALASLAQSRSPPRHLDLQVPAAFTDAVPLQDVLGALSPLAHALTSLGLETDAIQERDAQELARAAPRLQRLQLKIKRPSVSGLSVLVERLPHLEVLALLGPSKRLTPSSTVVASASRHGALGGGPGGVGGAGAATALRDLAQPAALEANMLGCAYAAFSMPRATQLTISVLGATPFAVLCANELGQLKPHAAGRTVHIVVTTS